MNGTDFNTSLNEILFTFVETGVYPIQIIAYNHVSKVVLDAEIECIDKLIGLYFHAGQYNKSTSLMSSAAQFRFYIRNGMGYQCVLDYGDGGGDAFDDSVIEQAISNS